MPRVNTLLVNEPLLFWVLRVGLNFSDLAQVAVRVSECTDVYLVNTAPSFFKIISAQVFFGCGQIGQRFISQLQKPRYVILSLVYTHRHREGKGLCVFGCNVWALFRKKTQFDTVRLLLLLQRRLWATGHCLANLPLEK